MGITIHDVAREAGISINTVSRALNGKPDVNDATRARVVETARRLGYVPNQAARTMATGRTWTIGLMVTDPANPIYARLIAGVEATVRRAGFSLLLYSSGEDPEREATGVRSLRQSRVEGLLAVPAPHPGRADGAHGASGTDAAHRANGASGADGVALAPAFAETAAHLPVIVLLRQDPALALDSAGWDNAAGAGIAVAHLLELGHRAIGYVGQDLPVSSVRVRHAGYRAALAKEGIGAQPEAEAHVPLSAAGAFSATQALLQRRPDLTALFVANDVLAPGVLTALRRAGRRVPEDVSVVSFGDLEVAPYTDPPLTTVHAPVEEVAAAAAERLLARIQGEPEARPWRFTATPHLVVRESTAPHRSTPRHN